MARIERVNKSRKEVVCCKCGKTLSKGSSYLKATPFHRPTIIRCIECGLRPYETSSSEFVQTCGHIVDKWTIEYGVDPDAIIEALDDLKETCQDNLDNIPEQLKDGSAGSLLQERIEMLGDVINELQLIDYDNIRDEVKDTYRSDNDIDEDTELDTEQQAEVDSLTEDEVSSAIEEALSGLDY